MKISMLMLPALVATLFTSQAMLAQAGTRAEIKSEAVAAVKAGDIAKGPSSGPGATANSVLDRGNVKMEAVAAVNAGTIAQGPSPGPGVKANSVRDRDAVKMEAVRAVKNGTVGKGPDIRQ